MYMRVLASKVHLYYRKFFPTFSFPRHNCFGPTLTEQMPDLFCLRPLPPWPVTSERTPNPNPSPPPSSPLGPPSSWHVSKISVPPLHLVQQKAHAATLISSAINRRIYDIGLWAKLMPQYKTLSQPSSMNYSSRNNPFRTRIGPMHVSLCVCVCVSLRPWWWKKIDAKNGCIT